jgi:hypothetical protein
VTPAVLLPAPAGAGRRRDGIQPHRGGPGRSSLGGVLLGPPKLSHRGGQGRQVRGERDGDQRALAGDLAGQRDQPGGGAQLVTRASGRSAVSTVVSR